MTCGSGCCGSNTPETVVAREPAYASRDSDDVNGTRCCAESGQEADDCCDDLCLRSVALKECLDSCAITDGKIDGKNSTNQSLDDQSKQNRCGQEIDGCLESVESDGSTRSSGCKNPADQCCSPVSVSVPEKVESCVKDVDSPSSTTGLRNRRAGCCSSQAKNGKSRQQTGIEPCEDHLEAARRRYTNMFGAMSCMCKALLAQGLESCCTAKRRLAPERIRNAPSSRTRDSCCRKEPKTKPQATDSCCASRKGDVTQCSPVNARSKPGSRIEKHSVDVNEELEHDRTVPVYLEAGSGNTEHIVLSVQGMTCTGCETKLHRSIKAIASATNAQASIVLSRAEFEIDPNVTTAEQAIAQLERATGFVLKKLSTGGNELFVRATSESRNILGMKLPIGVLDVKALDEHELGISYDANHLGARDLLERSYGMRLELAPIRPPDNIAAGAKHVRHTGYMTVFSAALTIPVLVLAWAPLPPNEVAYQSASLALATTVQVVVAGPFYSSALRSLIFSRVIEMDLLIVLSTSAAYIFSVVAYAYTIVGHPLSTGEFFESSTLLVTLIMIGRFISAFARQKAVESISMASLQPTKAILLDEKGNMAEEIDSRVLQYGDVFLVMPDSRVVTDGTVVYGQSEADESMVTGESKLIAKDRGSSVVAGSVNRSGTLHVKVARLPGENTISSIAEMVDRAKLSKPKIQEFADKVAGYFVPVIVAITIIVFCIWIAIGIKVRHQSGSETAVTALTYAIAVLIISCPCAVGLAVPMVVVIACGVGADRGIVFKSAQSIECGWRATHVVFDKTGTLTEGNARVVREELLTTKKSDCLSLLLGLVSGNKHPSSMAMTMYLNQRDIVATPPDFVQTVVGKGVEGYQNGKLLKAGSASWLEMEQLDAVQSLQSMGMTTLCFAIDGVPQAVFGLADTLRSEAKSVVSNLRSRGIEVSIVSGDDAGAVDTIGRELGLDSSNLRAKCAPQDKQDFIQSLTNNPKNIVIFCGDGTNDAGALAQATIGVHMSEGTDVARSASDAVLMRSDLCALITCMEISHAAYRRIVLNFCWAGVYNLFAILLAAGAFVDWRIPPQYAGLGEVVSVLPVVVVALQMKWIRI